jgi:hypothetical protein
MQLDYSHFRVGVTELRQAPGISMSSISERMLTMPREIYCAPIGPNPGGEQNDLG